MANAQCEMLEMIDLHISQVIANGAALHVKSMAALLARSFPQSGMSEKEISQLVAQAGIRLRVSMEFG